MRRVLILGGTGQALELARDLALEPDLHVTTSLAGRTRRPRLPPGAARIGGFGGADGLARHLRERRIDLLIDATHPFATRMSDHAARAARAAGVPLLVLRRAAGPTPAGALAASDFEAALATARPLGRRLLVTFRIEHLPQPPEPGCEVFVRAIEPPARPPPEGVRWLLDRGPYRVADELRLLERLAIDVVIAKASGGSGASAKLEAARTQGVAVILLPRPPWLPGGVTVERVSDAVRWTRDQLLGRST